MTMQAIKDRYGVPAHRGNIIKFRGRLCTITSADGHHLWLRDVDTEKRVGPCHPLWEMDYLDGVDHGARYDARVEAFNAAIKRGTAASKPKDERDV